MAGLVVMELSLIFGCIYVNDIVRDFVTFSSFKLTIDLLHNWGYHSLKI